MNEDRGWAREREAMLALTLCDGLGAIGIGRLIEEHGSAVAALDAPAPSWSAALGCAVTRAVRLKSRVSAGAARDELAAGRGVGATLVVRGEPAYPPLLAAIPDPPPAFWMRGELREEDAWAVAVVGSRRASAYGIDQAARFANALAERGHAVVSGGARGIDAEAHRAAIRAGGRTIAVLGSGLARPYPPEHVRLFDEIVASGGAVISEFPIAMAPRPELFPRRNRIVSGLSIGVLVIEARRRSGASITARLAVEDHGREAMAVPGRIDSASSEGCHRAIREGWAALVASPEDLFDQLSSAHHLVQGAAARFGVASAAARYGAPDVPMSAMGLRLAQLLVREGPLSLDDLCTGDVSTGAVLAEITMFELKGLVERDARGRYQARRALIETVAGKREG